MNDRSNEPPGESPDPVATSQDSLWPIVRRSFLSPVTLALIVLTVPLAVWGVLRTAADPADHGILTAFLLFATSTLPVAWSVIRVIWSESANTAIFVALMRTVFLPLVIPWLPAVAVAVTVHVPTVSAQLQASQDEYGWRYFFGERDGSLLGQALGLGGLAGVIFSMLTALALSVFVVFPVLAWLKPIGAARSNMLLTKTPEDRAAATSSIRLLSVVLFLTFAVPTLIVFGADEATTGSWFEALKRSPRVFVEPQYYYGDFMWALGVILIPLGVVAIIRLRWFQRPDTAARAKLGVNTPADQRRFEREQAQAQDQDQCVTGDDSNDRPGAPGSTGD